MQVSYNILYYDDMNKKLISILKGLNVLKT